MIQAAGLLVFRRQADSVEVLLSHPGGPLWAGKDEWSIPKGEVDAGETLLQTMEREFLEEIGIEPPADALISLGSAPTSTSKTNHIWAAEADLDLSRFHCESMVVMEWPRRSGMTIEFPENDKAEWFGLQAAYPRIFTSQRIFLVRLAEHLGLQLDKTTAARS
jgi:predicted NUDIX family NTP pyrophosphohydrolase